MSSIYINRILPYGGSASLWHYGIKGMRWGIRKRDKKSIENTENSVTIINDTYHSKKGFTVAVTKFTKYCLSPEKKHSEEFFDVGYSESDSDLLFRHIEEQFDSSKLIFSAVNSMGQTKMSMPMILGVTKKRTFTTAWQIDKPGDPIRFISAYRDRRNEGGQSTHDI